MKFITAIAFSIIFCCCSNEKNYPKAENALDAGREFIDGCLKGDFERAAFYMTNDAHNKELLQTQQKNYNAKSKEEKQLYNNASIIINEDAVLDDSTHIINYRNSFDKTARKVKVVQQNKEWLVDFKYTFDGNL